MENILTSPGQFQLNSDKMKNKYDPLTQYILQGGVWWYAIRGVSYRSSVLRTETLPIPTSGRNDNLQVTNRFHGEEIFMCTNQNIMRTLKIMLLLIIVHLTGCEKDDIYDKLDDGFNIVLNDEIIISHDDFDYYDYSTHFLYFNSDNPFVEYFKDIGDFAVFADGIKIYGGKIVPENKSDFIYMGPTIRLDSNYGDYILRIIPAPAVPSNGKHIEDPRKDIRIVNSLMKYGQFHPGLICEIESVQADSNMVILKLSLKNDDSFNYYYLDPEKMGVNLFHNYAWALFIQDTLVENSDTGYGYIPYGPHDYYADIEIESPYYWNYWNIDWMSLIKSGETKTLTIKYDKFTKMPPGVYFAFFGFSGLNIQLSKEETELDEGIIWQGTLGVFKKILIE